MYILVPTLLTESMLVSSTCAEPAAGETVWVSTDTYALGAEVISLTSHRKYRSLVAGNIGHNPTLATPTVPTAYWADIGADARWAMFDGENTSQTATASPLTVVLQPGFFNGLFLGGLDATALAITVKDAPGGTIIYSYAGELEGSHPGDRWEYFFMDFKPQTEFVASGIEPHANAELTVTLTGGTCKCGVLAVGDLRPMGDTQYGAQASPRSFSYIKTDAAGNNTIVRRKKARDMSCSCWLKLSDANAAYATLTEVMDVPCLWIGTDLDDYNGLRCWGIGNGKISYDHPKDVLLSVEVKGMI